MARKWRFVPGGSGAVGDGAYFSGNAGDAWLLRRVLNLGESTCKLVELPREIVFGRGSPGYPCTHSKCLNDLGISAAGGPMSKD